MLLRETYERSLSSLQEVIDGLNSQLKSFQEKMKRVEESILSRDYKKHIQDYGSPSQFWEQELESLHFVIEMKNERIHDLDKKLLNLETVVGLMFFFQKVHGLLSRGRDGKAQPAGERATYLNANSLLQAHSPLAHLLPVGRFMSWLASQPS
ncbi:Coiled-coil domain-containing protein 69 [Chelonia mydas]|uniref:Coiled-coil domain-containing protein 69 n=1 Tax=Chelonia mydas TaxID=8469 RepID=M7AK02_CHEMY|nr:Coiled-coil domain-containing protein 69 [Chelonia mydas]